MTTFFLVYGILVLLGLYYLSGEVETQYFRETIGTQTGHPLFMPFVIFVIAPTICLIEWYVSIKLLPMKMKTLAMQIYTLYLKFKTWRCRRSTQKRVNKIRHRLTEMGLSPGEIDIFINCLTAH